MDWANEPYVNFPAHDCETWRRLDWRARSVLMLLAREVDRAGVLNVRGFGDGGLAKVLDLPIEVVAPGIAQLVEVGCVARTPWAFRICGWVVR